MHEKYDVTSGGGDSFECDNLTYDIRGKRGETMTFT